MIQGDTFCRQLKKCELAECEIEVMEAGVVVTQAQVVIVAIAFGNYQVASYHFLPC
jgi:hypothetical protein